MGHETRVCVIESHRQRGKRERQRDIRTRLRNISPHHIGRNITDKRARDEPSVTIDTQIHTRTLSMRYPPAEAAQSGPMTRRLHNAYTTGP